MHSNRAPLLDGNERMAMGNSEDGAAMASSNSPGETTGDLLGDDFWQARFPSRFPLHEYPKRFFALAPASGCRVQDFDRRVEAVFVMAGEDVTMNQDQHPSRAVQP